MPLPTMIRSLLAAVVLFIACGSLGAQNPYPVRDLRVEPSPAIADTTVVLRGTFDNGHLYTLSSSVTRAGNVINVEHVVGFLGVGTPPAAQPFEISLGSFPEGAYSVVYQPRSINAFPWSAQTFPLAVLGGTRLPVPVISAHGGALLVVITLALGLWGFRRYR